MEYANKVNSILKEKIDTKSKGSKIIDVVVRLFEDFIGEKISAVNFSEQYLKIWRLTRDYDWLIHDEYKKLLNPKLTDSVEITIYLYKHNLFLLTKKIEELINKVFSDCEVFEGDTTLYKKMKDSGDFVINDNELLDRIKARYEELKELLIEDKSKSGGEK